jgi:hypothetical protein
MKFKRSEIGQKFTHRLSGMQMILTAVSGDHPTDKKNNRGIMSAIEYSEMYGLRHVTKDLYSFEFREKEKENV